VIAYVDTSSIVAIALRQPGYESIATKLASFEQLFTSTLTAAVCLFAAGADETGAGRSHATIRTNSPIEGTRVTVLRRSRASKVSVNLNVAR
jgi:uncharacterized protein with PIN domain